MCGCVCTICVCMIFNICIVFPKPFTWWKCDPICSGSICSGCGETTTYVPFFSCFSHPPLPFPLSPFPTSPPCPLSFLSSCPLHLLTSLLLSLFSRFLSSALHSHTSPNYLSSEITAVQLELCVVLFGLLFSTPRTHS